MGHTQSPTKITFVTKSKASKAFSSYNVKMEFPDAEEHARAILEAVKGDYQTALERIPVLRLFGFAEEYCRRLEILLTPQAEMLIPVTRIRSRC